MALILVVEDDEDIREIIAEVLLAEGHDILQSCNGAQALKLLRVNRVDLVITDIIMAEKDGIEMLLELRRHHPGVKAIAFSGGGKAGGSTYLSMARSLGAKYVLTKPFPIDALLIAVKNTLNSDPIANTEITPRHACSIEIQGAT